VILFEVHIGLPNIPLKNLRMQLRMSTAHIV